MRNFKDVLTLKHLCYAIFVLWVIAQSFVVANYWGATQYSDAGGYQLLAIQCFQNGSWYPNPEQIQNDQYIFNPGYVNLLIVCLRLFGTINAALVINVLLNIGIALCLFRIFKKLANTTVAYIGVILYCCLWSNIIVVAPTMSDILFLFALLLSIVLIRDKGTYLFASAAVLCFANYVRPIGLLFLVPIVIYFILNRYKWHRYLAYISGYTLLTLALITFNYRNSGYKIVSASTGGVNLIMGANDEMNGSYCSEVFREGKLGYIDQNESYDVFQKDSIWKARSKEWIKANPIKYAKYMPLKLVRLWLGDDYQDINFNKEFKSQVESNKAKRIVEILSYSIVYYIIFVFALIGLFQYWKKLWGVYGLLLIPVAGACCMHMLMYGGMRYHYPYIPILVFFAACAIYELYTRRTRQSTDNHE